MFFQIPGGENEEEILGRERGCNRTESQQGSRTGVFHVRVMLGAVFPA